MSQLPFPRAILSQHSADLGKTGAGKSSALRVMVEDLLDRQKRVAYLSRLAARRLVETPGSGLVQAAGALFD